MRTNDSVRDWERWMVGMGLYTRRLRELVGLSQEQLARLAGVSQGAVSRLEMGRAVHTPLIVVMKVNAAMRVDPQFIATASTSLMSWKNWTFLVGSPSIGRKLKLSIVGRGGT